MFLHPDICIPVQHRIFHHISCLSCLSWLSQRFIRTEMTNSCQSKKGTTKPEHLEEWTDAQQWATRGYNNTHIFILIEWMIVVVLLQYQLWQVFFSLRQHGWPRKKHLFFYLYVPSLILCFVFFVINESLILLFFFSYNKNYFIEVEEGGPAVVCVCACVWAGGSGREGMRAVTWLPSTNDTVACSSGATRARRLSGRQDKGKAWEEKQRGGGEEAARRVESQEPVLRAILSIHLSDIQGNK